VDAIERATGLMFHDAKNTCAPSPVKQWAACYKLLMQFAMDKSRVRIDNPAGN
jgi:hypothetical protein